jgi:hypothetical protein
MSTLWDLVSSHDDLDPQLLALALQEQCRLGLDDPRTRQLAYECWLALLPWNVQLPEIPPALEPVGKFPGLPRRIALVTTSENILGFLREISLRLTAETRIVIGGSSALILDQLLQRATQDVDLVDEVPQALRTMRAELERAEGIYHLHFAHFQSHYLPEHWADRLVSLPPLRKLQAYRVSSLDVYVGKLFSRREKDARDLVALRPAFSRSVVEQHVADYGLKLLADPKLRNQIEDNWYVLYGEDLPSAWSC